MYIQMAKRAILETDKRLLWKFLWRMGLRAPWSVLKHKRRMKRGEFFPPFFYVAVTNTCNLRCQGCWMDVTAKQERVSLDAMTRLITEAQQMGNVFFGLVGGEPLLHPELMQIFERHPDCYFQVFTNGHFLTDDVAKELRRFGNVTPLVSIEGSKLISDQRRGRTEVYDKSIQGLQNCLNNKLLTGVCTSVCKTNIDDLVTEAWVDRLIEMGVFYTWFHVYRPVGPNPCPELALSPEQQLRVRRFVVQMRATKPIAIIDAYHDGHGRALCPAITGVSHHIGPWGDIEPCPIIQFSKESIHEEGRTLREKLVDSEFLHEFREMVRSTTRGCIVLERPDLLRDLVIAHEAKDTTARQTGLAELAAMEERTSQFSPLNEIPEKSLVYRFIKRFLFSDFGVYDELDRRLIAEPTLQSEQRRDQPTAVSD